MSSFVGQGSGSQGMRPQAEPRPWIAGACAGLAARAGIRPWIPRAGAVFLLLIHPIFMLLFYAAAAVLLRRGGLAGRPGWFERPRWFGRWPRYKGRAFRTPSEPPSPLTEIGSRLAALDRRLDSLEAVMSESDR